VTEIECSDPREPYGCPWEDHEHDEDFHVVNGEWRQRYTLEERNRRLREIARS
jgi:hypothetical protein